MITRRRQRFLIPYWLGVTLAVFLCAQLISVGCDVEPTSEPVVISELIGEYEANYGDDFEESIVLRADNSYIHTMKYESGTTISDTSHWGLVNNETGREPVVHLHSFVTRFPVRSGGQFSRERQAIQDLTPRTYRIYVYKSKGGHIWLKRWPNSNQNYYKAK